VHFAQKVTRKFPEYGEEQLTTADIEHCTGEEQLAAAGIIPVRVRNSWVSTEWSRVAVEVQDVAHSHVQPATRV
jgi:hypothetical protein